MRSTQQQSQGVQWWRYICICPLVSGIAWFCTLSPLLVLWLVDGRPAYPGQSNPYVAFISDIGAFRLQPLFIIGCCVTGFMYFLTMLGVYFARYDSRTYNIQDPMRKKAISGLGVIGGLVACVCLILLSAFDTFDHHQTHARLLLSTFLGLGVSALCTIGVYLENPFTHAEDLMRNRPFCTMCSLIVVVEVGLSIIFFVCQYSDHMRVAGIFEWVITFVGVSYLLTLVGFLLPPKSRAEGERTPLLPGSRNE